jgi:dienelactone hydrolase
MRLLERRAGAADDGRGSYSHDLEEEIMIKLAFLLAGLMAVSGFAQNGIMTADVEYTIEGKPFLGYVAVDTTFDAPRPGVLIIHQWMGLTDYEKMRARQLAELGYVAFAADIYGEGIRPKNREEAQQEAGKYYGNTELYRARVKAGLEQLKMQEKLDTMRVAAIGYCFGGKGVLELARSGADIAGVVTFHGSLGTDMPADSGDIKAKVLVLHGADDPYADMDEVMGFINEMKDAHAIWELDLYGNTVHSFTQKSAGDDPSTGAAYNALADKRSWERMGTFFNEIF